MGKTRNRILGLTAATMAVGVVACEDASTEVVTQPDGAVLTDDVTTAGAALDGVSTVEVEFRGTWNPELGTFELETLSQRLDTPGLVIEDGEILRESEQGLYCPIRVTAGRPDTVTLGTSGIGFTPVDCGFTGFPYDTQGAFCATIDVTSNYSVELSNVYAELTTITPDTGHNGYAYPLGTGANPAAVAPGNGAPSDVLGLWGYDTIAGGATGSTQWTMQYTPEPFSFQGRIAATVAETCDSLDDDCDGLIDEGAGCYAVGDACTDNADCQSFNCDSGTCGSPLPEDCTAEGDEDGNGVADCQDLVCAGQADPFGGTCPSCGIQISDLGTYTGSTVGGTSQNAERSSNDVTYFFTAPVTGDYSFDTCGSDFDTYLYIFDGTCGVNGTTVAFDDDAADTFCDTDVNQSHIETVSLTAGTEYMVVVEGWSASDEGTVGLNIAYNGSEADFGAGVCTDGLDNNNNGSTDCDDAGCSLVDGCPAARGLCANPFAVGSYGVYTGSTAAATDDDAPSATCTSATSANDHAYLFVAPATGQVTIDMENSAIDTIVYVQTTCGDSLTEIACNNDEAFLDQDAQVTFGAVEGESYYIIVDGAGESGDYEMEITGPAPPAYDCTAPGLTVGYGTYNGLVTLADTNTYATCGAGLGGDRVYEFTSPASGTVTLELDADFAASISVREDVCTDDLAEQGCQQGDGTSPVTTTFTATQNVTYYIFIDAVGATDSGQFTLDISGPAAPAETCAEPNLIPAFGTYFTNTGGLSDNETSSCGFSTSPEAIFEWTAPVSGTYAATTAGSAFDTILSVIEGDCSSGTEIACDDDEAFPDVSTSRVAFTATAGTNYYFLVQGFSSSSGNVVLTLEGPENLYAGLSCTDGTDNDNDGYADCLDNDCSGVDGCAPVTPDSCVDETTLDVGNAGTFATLGNGDNFIDEASEDYSFLFTAPADGEYVFETCGADFDTALSFYVGDCTTSPRAQLGGTTFDPSNCDDGLGETFTLGGLTAGDTVMVVVESVAGEAGTFPMNVIFNGFENELGTCDDSIDNNNDGLTDCVDPTCAGLDGCPALPGTCGDPFVANIGSNLGDNSVDSVSALAPFTGAACTAGTSGASLENVWTFTAPSVDGLIDVRTDGSATTHTDTTLYIRAATECDTATSDLACDDDGGAGFNSLIQDFATTAGTSYIIVVDSYQFNAGGAYDLEIAFEATAVVPGVSGCRDPLAVNYDSLAIYDAGTCDYGDNTLTLDFSSDGFAPDSWEIRELDNTTVVASGELTDQSFYMAPGCYLFVGLADNGWGGITVDAVDNGTNVTVDDFTVGFGVTESSTYLSFDANGTGTGCTFGCTDSSATNYNASADADDGSCAYPTVGPYDFVWNPTGSWTSEHSFEILDASGTQLASASGTDEVIGLVLSDGCYTVAGADSVGDGWDGGALDILDSTGLVMVSGFNMNGGASNAILLNVNSLVTCAFGCTDATAGNYDAAATNDDGSCTYPTGCTDNTADNYDPSAVTDDGSCDWGDRNMSLDFSFTGSAPDAWEVRQLDNTTVVASGDLEDQTFGLDAGCYLFVGLADSGWGGNAVDAIDAGSTVVIDDFTVGFGVTESSTYLSTTANGTGTGCTFGCTDSSASNYNASADADDGSCTYPVVGPYDFVWDPTGSWTSEHSFEILDASGTQLASASDVNEVIGLVLPDGCYTLAGADSVGDGWDGGALDVRDSTGLVLVDGFNMNGGASNSILLNLNSVIPCAYGCTDATSPDYDAAATNDDGSCTYPAVGPFTVTYANNGGNGWCDETAWDIQDSSSTIMASAGPASGSTACGELEVTTPFALADGCYQWNATDSFSNGLDADGVLSLVDSNGYTVASLSGNFGSSTTLDFGVNATCP